MQKKIFSNILLLVIVNLLIKPLWVFGIDLQVQNTVGVSTYGWYFAIFNYSFLLHILLDIGINQYNNRTIAQKPELIKKQFSALFSLKTVFALSYLILSFLFAFLLDFDKSQLHLLLFLVVNQALLSFILFARSNFTALQWYRWDAFFSVFDRVLSILFCAILLFTTLLTNKFQIEYFVYAQTIALLISAVSSLLVVAKNIDLEIKFTFDWSLLKSSLPFALVVLLMSIYTRIDAVMIAELLPDEKGSYEAGLYAAGYRLLDAINMVPYLFASILIPVFARKLADKENYSYLIKDAFKLLLALSTSVSIITYFFGTEILDLLYKDAEPNWNNTFVLLMFSFNAICITYVFGGFLTAANRLKAISLFASFAIITNIVLNYFLILKYGAMGAAAATLLTQSIMALAQMIYALKTYQLKLPIAVFIKLFAFGVVLVACSYGLNQFQFGLFVNLAVIILIAISLALGLKLVNSKIILLAQDKIEK